MFNCKLLSTFIGSFCNPSVPFFTFPSTSYLALCLKYTLKRLSPKQFFQMCHFRLQQKTRTRPETAFRTLIMRNTSIIAANIPEWTFHCDQQLAKNCYIQHHQRLAEVRSPLRPRSYAARSLVPFFLSQHLGFL